MMVLPVTWRDGLDDLADLRVLEVRRDALAVVLLGADDAGRRDATSSTSRPERQEVERRSSSD